MNMSLLITLFLLLSGATSDEYALARAIQGEAGQFTNSNPEVLDHVGTVVTNRLAAGWCNSIKSCIADGFWGINNVRIPTQAALESAQRVLRGESQETNDMFVFSLQDCEDLNLDINLATYIAIQGNWTLVFFENNISLKENK